MQRELMRTVPEMRIKPCNAKAVRRDGSFVLYWMIAFRRVHWNFSLQRAVQWALKLGKPLVILEPLSRNYPWASLRFHRFVVQGMLVNARHCSKAPVTYLPFIEETPGQGKELFEQLISQACLVVSDDFPAFSLPRLVQAAAEKCPVLMEGADSNGLLPMDAATRVYPTAFLFRRFLQRELVKHLGECPAEKPLQQDLAQLPSGSLNLPASLKNQTPLEYLNSALGGRLLKGLPDPATPSGVRGGARAAQGRLRSFLKEKLDRYATARNQPQEDVTSGLSPYLHFGHISSHQVFAELMRREGWSPADLRGEGKGKRKGWWGVSEGAEAFLDQLVTWREVGFNMCRFNPAYASYDSLPDWARRTLEAHSRDERPFLYSFEQLQAGATHDELWNAAQKQLLSRGTIHNYLRMLWGKKILEWTPSPRTALEVMIELNNRFALDGRDPNSYTGIFWCLGRYDRPWGPERPVFGTVRYMSSRNTARKFRVSEYLTKYP